MVLVLEKNRLDLGVSSRSTSTALLSTRNPDFLPRKLPEEPKILERAKVTIARGIAPGGLRLSPKRRILGGLFKFLAVGCGLNEISD